MVIFRSYVKLPDGISCDLLEIWVKDNFEQDIKDVSHNTYFELYTDQNCRSEREHKLVAFVASVSYTCIHSINQTGTNPNNVN